MELVNLRMIGLPGAGHVAAAFANGHHMLKRRGFSFGWPLMRMMTGGGRFQFGLIALALAAWTYT